MMRYTRNTNRYISNAGGGGGGREFFILTPHTAIFKPTDSVGIVACPARFESRRGTEDAPLISSGKRMISKFFDSIKISPAALFLLNKVFNFIWYKKNIFIQSVESVSLNC
jgi:hypothetical protein